MIYNYFQASDVLFALRGYDEVDRVWSEMGLPTIIMETDSKRRIYMAWLIDWSYQNKGGKTMFTCLLTRNGALKGITFPSGAVMYLSLDVETDPTSENMVDMYCVMREEFDVFDQRDFFDWWQSHADDFHTCRQWLDVTRCV